MYQSKMSASKNETSRYSRSHIVHGSSVSELSQFSCPEWTDQNTNLKSHYDSQTTVYVIPKALALSFDLLLANFRTLDFLMHLQPKLMGKIISTKCIHNISRLCLKYIWRKQKNQQVIIHTPNGNKKHKHYYSYVTVTSNSASLNVRQLCIHHYLLSTQLNGLDKIQILP